MTGSGLLKSGSSSGRGPDPPLPKAPSRSQSIQRNPSRRVIFSETPTPKHQSRNWDSNKADFLEIPPQKQTRNWDEENVSEMSTKNQDRDWDSSDDRKERRGRRLCCAWTLLTVGCIFLVLLLMGALSLSFIRGALPEFRIKRLNITRLEFSTKDKQTLLNADIQLLINTTNNNDKYDFSYSAMKVEVSSEDINLGKAEVPAFKHNAKMVEVLKVSTGIKKSVVDEAAAEDLKLNYKEKQVVIDVVFRASIDLNMEGHKLSGLPLEVLCSSIEQSEVDNGLQPQCRVKIFKFL